MACKKEYSFEGGGRSDSTTLNDQNRQQDLIKPSGITLPGCKECNRPDTSTLTSWSFKVGNSLLCGNVTKAVVSPDRNAFTFFGPSTCSSDSGLIITAYFNTQVLKKDQSNLIADRAAFQYYNNITMNDILLSKPPNVFSLTIDRYTMQSGVATGTFNGWVVDEKGNVTKVDVGKFRIQF